MFYIENIYHQKNITFIAKLGQVTHHHKEWTLHQLYTHWSKTQSPPST